MMFLQNLFFFRPLIAKNDLEKAINLDIIEWEKIKIEKSKIIVGILELIDELKAEEKEAQKFIFLSTLDRNEVLTLTKR